MNRTPEIYTAGVRCPDCKTRLPCDGSCCDACGWTWHGGGDDPRLPSDRSKVEIETEQARRLRDRIHRGRHNPFNVGDVVTVNNSRELFTVEAIDGPLCKLIKAHGGARMTVHYNHLLHEDA